MFQDTRNSLKDLAKDNTVQIEALIADRNKLRSNVEEVKYSGLNCDFVYNCF